MASTLKRSALPAHVNPMLCTLVEAAFDDPNWVFEPKLDGLRVICRFDGKRLTLLSRNDKPQDFQFPEIVGALRANLGKPAILDGEIVCFDAEGKPSFRELQQRFHIEDRATVVQRMKKHPAYIYLFDILFFDRADVRPLPLSERKKLLRKAIRSWRSPLFWTEPTRGRGIELLNEACKRHEEGIVAKKLDSPYVDYRSGAWLKIKCSGRQEFVIVGYTDPQGSRVAFGALLVAYYSDDGKQLIYAGKVGTGFDRQKLLDLHARMKKLEVKDRPDLQGGPVRCAKVHWVKPKLVAEIAFAEWTQHEILRQPRFEGLRDDKPAAAIRKEKPRLYAKPSDRVSRDALPVGSGKRGRR